MSNTDHNLVKIGITMGDINGVGPEVIIKTFLDNRMMQVCTPVVYGSSKTASFYRKQLNTGEFTFNIIKDASQATNKNANMINVWDEETKVDVGESTELGGAKALQSLQAVVADLKAGKLDAMVTAPINKNNIQSAEFKFPGHTEFLAEYFGTNKYLMLLVNGSLRVGTVTGHIPLSEVSKAISKEKIIEKAEILNQSLIKDFCIRKPKIAILGLNPHAGDNGLLGKEEIEIISPAVNQLREKGILAFGPYAADGFFGSGAFENYDGILAMYHDQGLAPFKAMSFSSGVNFTAGLPIVRTSPDHGTAYDIAGKNLASENSFREAIYLACDIVKNRKLFQEVTENPLPFGTYKKERG